MNLSNHKPGDRVACQVFEAYLHLKALEYPTVRLFTDRKKAEEWVMNERRGTNPQAIFLYLNVHSIILFQFQNIYIRSN